MTRGEKTKFRFADETKKEKIVFKFAKEGEQ